MFSGFKNLDGFKSNLFNGISTNLSDNKSCGIGYPFFWLRADKGITKDSADLVSEWKDKDGRDYAFLQDTLAYKPKWILDSGNGQNGILFDGSGDYMRIIKALPFKDVFFVFNWGGNETVFPIQNGLFTTYTNTGNVGKYIVALENTTSLRSDYYDNFFHNNSWIDNKKQNNVAPIQDFHIFNGQSLTASTHNDFLLGQLMNVGYYWKGYVSEILFFKEHLSVAQTNYWANYLAARYGITLQG